MKRKQKESGIGKKIYIFFSTSDETQNEMLPSMKTTNSSATIEYLLISLKELLADLEIWFMCSTK